MSPPTEPGTPRRDPYAGRFAARARGMTASEIRALFAVASRPEIVSLAGGMPNLAALPLDAVGDMIGGLVRSRGLTALQYSSAQGDPRLRELICDVMALEGIRGHASDVMVTVGSQQGLDLCTRIFCDPGDVVLVEAPSYVGALGVFASYQAEVCHVAMDEHGLVPEALEEAAGRAQRRGRPAKFLYTVPNFHNPAGVCLEPQRRGRILEIAARWGFFVVEDNPYGLLGFEGEPQAALRAADAENVVYLGTFSKTFAPGLRVGWVLAPEAVRAKLVLANEAATLCPPTFSQLVVAEYLATQPWQEQIKAYREVYRERRDAALDALAQAGSGWSYTRPQGGFYVWLALPVGIDAKAMLPRAIAHRVAYVPGTGFYADGAGADHLRLSYCYPQPDRIREGIRRLAAAIEEEQELVSTFGPGSAAPLTGRFPRADGPNPDLS